MRLESPMAVLISDKLMGHTIPKSVHVPYTLVITISLVHVVHTIERASGCHVARVTSYVSSQGEEKVGVFSLQLVQPPLPV